MAKLKKEGPAPIPCVCKSAAIWSKSSHGFFYACPNCLNRGSWRKTLDRAAESWNTEILQIQNNGGDKDD